MLLFEPFQHVIKCWISINVLSIKQQKKKLNKKKYTRQYNNQKLHSKLKYIADAYNSVIQITIALPYIHTRC